MAYRNAIRANAPETEIADVAEESFSQSDPKPRRCLRCQTQFHSEWAGERVCQKCKGSSSWRSGVPNGTPSSRR